MDLHRDRLNRIALGVTALGMADEDDGSGGDDYDPTAGDTTR
jgi:hypothetical protein